MLVKTVSASAKGQLTLPVSMLRAMGIKGPTEFLAVQDGDRVILRKASAVAQREVDDLEGWLSLAEPSLREVWDHPDNEVWNDF